MLDLHGVLEFLMFLTIALLIHKQIQQTRDYEQLKIRFRDCQENCHSCHNKKHPPFELSRTSEETFISPPSSSQSHQESGVYWTSYNTPPETQKHFQQKQKLLPSDSLNPSSFPLSSTQENPWETDELPASKDLTTFTVESRIIDKQSVHIPETEDSSGSNILSIPSSDDTTRLSRKDEDLHIQESSHVVSSFVSNPSLSHDPPVLTSPTESLLSVDSDDGIKMSDGLLYSLPVDKTTILSNLNDHYSGSSIKTSISLSLDEKSEQDQAFDNLNPSKTTVESEFLKDASLDKVNHYGPSLASSHTSFIMQSSQTLDMAVPLSNTEQNVFGDERLRENDIDFTMKNHEGCHDSQDSLFTTNDLKDSEVFGCTTDNKIEPMKMDVDEHRDIVMRDDANLILPSSDKSFLSGGSMAHCGEGNSRNRYCAFKNICYSAKKKDFIFFKGPNSIVESDMNGNAINVFAISLTTLSEHNAFMFPIVMLPIETLSHLSVHVIHKKSIALSRFKPDNIMHVLHDDVLPLYRTLDEFHFPKVDGSFDALIVFTDPYDNGDYFDLYSSISSIKPLSLTRYNNTEDIVCFSDIHIGLSTSTVWYQYGFFKPQGPISNLDKNAFLHIQDATQRIAKSFASDCHSFLCKQKDYLVFLSRKDNRLILNEGDLIMSLSQSTRLKVFSVSLESHSFSEIITIVKSSRGIIGMHGSLLSVAVFLPRDSIVIELFPFAIDPSRYTPFKTLCDLPGSSLTYKAWVNSNRHKSVPHPDWSPEEGGISHLSLERQEEIESQESVPEHLCCNDPSWLYHIYQDTLVDVPAVVAITVQALGLHTPEISLKKLTNIPDIPGSVELLKCREKVNDQYKDVRLKKDFIITWEPNWSLALLLSYNSHYNFRYEVIVQQQNSVENQISVLNLDVLSYEFSGHFDVVYNVWVTVIVMGDSDIRSQARHTMCH